MVSIKYHFRKIDLVIYLPIVENKGKKNLDYLVTFRNRKSGKTQKKRRISLKDVINMSEIRDNYPQSIGVYLDSTGRGKNWIPEYLITKNLANNQEFLSLIETLKP
jgi:hypothetical protein